MQTSKEILLTSLEYLYGKGITSYFPWNQLTFIKSKPSNRIKSVLYKGKTFVTIKENGIITLSMECARFMDRSYQFSKSCVKITREVEVFISKGGNVFCKHIEFVGSNVRVGLDVGIINNKGNLIAVGKAIVPRSYMLSFKRGIAVMVRKGIMTPSHD